MHTRVEGEVASVTYHTSGHLYFTIKDDKSSLKCVMWRSAVVRMSFHITKGMHIIVEGSVSVYTPRGEYQFQATHIEPYGQGALALAFEQLKERLTAKGYFDTASKKPLPNTIDTIALVTAKESAALHDMLAIIKRRWPLVTVYVIDTLVQGSEAGASIAKALMYADHLSVDVVIVGRGGGATEDLWAFNQECVADAIFAMQTPVVSAVGHEVDIVISDYVADLRAPTPSAAIEMVLPDKQEILYLLSDTIDRYQQRLATILSQKQYALTHQNALLAQSAPRKQLEAIEMRLVQLRSSYHRSMRYRLEQFEAPLPLFQREMQHYMTFIIEKKMDTIYTLKERWHQNNPRLACKKGWVQVIHKGKKSTLASIQPQERFILEDAETKIEAQCLSKKEI